MPLTLDNFDYYFQVLFFNLSPPGMPTVGITAALLPSSVHRVWINPEHTARPWPLPNSATHYHLHPHSWAKQLLKIKQTCLDKPHQEAEAARSPSSWIQLPVPQTYCINSKYPLPSTQAPLFPLESASHCLKTTNCSAEVKVRGRGRQISCSLLSLPAA